jgi:hypothetical protein
MIAVACDKRALEFFRGPVAERFYLLTGERLRTIPEIEGPDRADFMVASERELSTASNIEAIRPLTPYMTFLANCDGGGNGG